MKKIIGSGSGKSGGGGRGAAKEDSDSLQSKAYASVIDLISEGEIEGLCNGLHSIYLDDTPLVDNSGNVNFSGVFVDYRYGTQYQTYISGFPSASNEIYVGVESTFISPVVRTISNSDINAVIIRISIPQLTYQDPNTGDLHGSEVIFVIETNSNGSGWVQKANDTINGKCVSKYQKSYRVELPPVGPHQVRLRRITPDSTQSNLSNKIYFDSYAEVIDAKLSYPNSAIIGVKVDASAFKAIPTRSYDVKLLKVKVPTNYDPILKVYTGIWDGTFKISWTDNPAWCFYDLLTNSRYGANLDHSLIDKWGLYSIAQYCDGVVDNGFGGKESRFTLNCYIQTRQEAYNVIKDLANVFRGIAFWQGGLLTAMQDSPADTSYLFTTSNVINGEFTYQGTSKKNRYTVALVTWNDPEDSYKQKVEYVEDAQAISKYGVIQTEVTAFGCTSRGQAHRVGKWIIYSSQNETETVNFQTGLEAANCRPGQVIKIQDPMRAGVRFSGRIKTASINSIIIDQDLDLEFIGNSYSISFMLPDGTVSSGKVQSSIGRVLNLYSPLTLVPHDQSVWILTSNDISPQYFRILSVTEDSGLFAITAISHDPNKFNYIESNVSLSERKITNLSITPNIPEGLNIIENLYEANGDVRVKAIFSWNNTPNASSFKVSYKKQNGNIISLGETRSNDFEILNIDPGFYDFFVIAVSSFGVESKQTKITYEIKGKSLSPSDVQGFSLIPMENTAYISWHQTQDLDVSIGGQIKIKFSPNQGATWKNSYDIALLSGSATRAQVPLMNGTYLAKFIDSSGNSSINTTSIYTDALEATTKNVVATLIEGPSFSGNKTNMFVDKTYGGLALSSNYLIDDWTSNVDLIPMWDYMGGVCSTGEYLFANSLDLYGVYTCNLTAKMDAFCTDVADLIDFRTDNIDDWLDIDGSFIDDVNAEIQVSTTNEDPINPSATWSDWKRFFVGQYKARAFKFKVTAKSDSVYHNIIINSLQVSVDMPDRVINSNSILCSTSGKSIVFDKPFAAEPTISITAFNMQAGDRHLITLKSNTGFTIIFKDSNNNPISRTFDYIAKGYGMKVN